MKDTAKFIWFLTSNDDDMGFTRVTKTATQSGISSTSYIDITDLTFPITAGQDVEVRGIIYGTSTNGTEGMGISINGPTLTNLWFQSITPLSANSIVGHSTNAYDAAASSVTLQNSGALIQFKGRVIVSANGTIAIRVKAEIGSPQTVDVLAGSYVEYRVL